MGRPSVCIILLIATSLSDSLENIPSIINRLNSIEANFALKELADDKLAEDVFMTPSTWANLLESKVPSNDLRQFPVH